MSLPSIAHAWVRTILLVAGAIIWLAAWYVPVTLAILYGSTVAVGIWSVATAGGAILWCARPGRPRPTARRFATLRLRRLGAATPWAAGLAVAAPLGIMALGILLVRCGYPVDRTPDFVDPLLSRPGGWWSASAMAVLVAPVIEEFAFRGWIQRTLERQIGAPWAITGTAVLFALVHDDLLRLPDLFLGGLVLGVLVYLTRSIWAGVAVHAGNNALAMLLKLPSAGAALAALGPLSLWESLAAMCLAAIVCTFLARGLWRATRRAGPPTPPGAAHAASLATGSVAS